MIDNIVFSLYKVMPLTIDFINGLIAKASYASPIIDFIVENIIGYNIF